MHWPYTATGEVLYEERALMNYPYTTLLILLQILLAEVLGFEGLIRNGSFKFDDIIYYCVFVPLLIIGFINLVNYIIFKYTTRNVFYRIRSEGIELSAANPMYPIPSPLFIPFDNLLYIGKYPSLEERKALLTKYSVVFDMGAVPTLRTFERDSLNTFQNGSLIIFKGENTINSVVFWPSKDCIIYLEKFCQRN